jgi:hypothetical protein
MSDLLCVALWFKFFDNPISCLDFIKIILMLSKFVNLLLRFVLQQPIYINDETFSLQNFILVSWIKIVFCGLRLRRYSLLHIIVLLLTFFVHA